MRFGPWVIAAAALAFVLHETDLEALRAALARATWGRYLVAASGFTGLWWLVDAFVLTRLVRRFHQPVSLRQLLPLRGATYLLLAFSYDAAQAAFALMLSRRFGISLAALGGTFLFYYLVDVLTISSLASLGCLAVPTAVGRTLAPILGSVLLGVSACIAFGAWGSRHATKGFPARMARSRIFATLRHCRLRDVLEFVSWRALFYATFIAFAATTLPAFHIRVPTPALVAFVPLIMSLSALPITVAGLGSTQVVMWALYGSYADTNAVVAYALAYNSTLVLFRIPIGLLCMPVASGSLVRTESNPVVHGEEVTS